MAKKSWGSFFQKKTRTAKASYNFGSKQTNDIVDFGGSAYKFDGKRWNKSQENDEQELEVSNSYTTNDENSFASSKAVRDLSVNVDARIADLVNGAPATLNTLKELADAVQNAEESDTISALTTLVGTKAKDDLTNVGTLPASVKAQLKGDTGETGAQGSTGAQGGTGATGSQGPQGGTGATGSQGPQGNTGSNGSNGSQGAQGPAGAVGPPKAVANFTSSTTYSVPSGSIGFIAFGQGGGGGGGGSTQSFTSGGGGGDGGVAVGGGGISGSTISVTVGGGGGGGGAGGSGGNGGTSSVSASSGTALSAPGGGGGGGGAGGAYGGDAEGSFRSWLGRNYGKGGGSGNPNNSGGQPGQSGWVTVVFF